MNETEFKKMYIDGVCCANGGRRIHDTHGFENNEFICLSAYSLVWRAPGH